MTASVTDKVIVNGKTFPLNQAVDCSFEDYQAAPGVNQSSLKDMLKSPRHYHSRHILKELEWKDTEALRFGRVVHSALLEPEHFDKHKAVEPDCDKRTTGGKAIQADFLSKLTPESVVCKESDIKAIDAMRRSLDQHPNLVDWLAGGGKAEQCVWWRDPRHGILCKARLDFVSNTQPFVIDLKTTEDAAHALFAKQVLLYSYQLQAAWYLRAMHDGLRAHSGWQFFFIALEKQAPYELVVYQAGMNLIKAGNLLADKAMDMLNTCQISDDWPGYTREIQLLELP